MTIYLITISKKDFATEETYCKDVYCVETDHALNIIVKAILAEYCQEQYTDNMIENIWLELFNANDKSNSAVITDYNGDVIEINGTALEIKGRNITGRIKSIDKKFINMASTLPDNCNLFRKKDIQMLFDI